MRFWMDVMRRLEPVLNDHDRLFDAWEAGGCDGLVIGPLMFNQPRLGKGAVPISDEGPPIPVFDPDRSIYSRFGVKAPEVPLEELPERRRLLEKTLRSAKDRGWSVWIFQPHVGCGPGGPEHHLFDELTHKAIAARSVDTLRHFPMVDGAVFDGPEWGYEIDPNHRSYLFNDLPESVRNGCARMGYDYDALCGVRDTLFKDLHGIHAPANVFDDVPGLSSWLRFRIESLTRYYSNIAGMIRAEMDRPVKLACGPRTATFAPLASYDMTTLAGCMDVLLPKLYIWHRGFDGMVGTVGRYVETLCAWNPLLSEEDALVAVEALFGLRLPGVRNRLDLESAITPEFFSTIITREVELALDAVSGDAERLVPWVDAGRFPHDGDPVPARDLKLLLDAASEAGLRRFTYHHAENLTAGEWNVISAACGTYPPPSGLPHYQPADELVL